MQANKQIDHRLSAAYWRDVVVAEHLRRMADPFYVTLSRAGKARELAVFCWELEVPNAFGERLEPGPIERYFHSLGW